MGVGTQAHRFPRTTSVHVLHYVARIILYTHEDVSGTRATISAIDFNHSCDKSIKAHRERIYTDMGKMKEAV